MKTSNISISNLHRWIRELHLYFGLFISPFILLYAISTILFNHTWKSRSAESEAKAQMERVSIEMPEGMEGLELAKYIMRKVNVSGEIEFFRHNLQQKQFVIPVMKPGQRITISVDLENKTAEIERRRTGFWSALLYLHKSPGPHLAGFRGNWFYTRLWKWMADATVYLILLVSITGIYMWWVLKVERKVGLVLVGAGCLTFILIALAIV